MRSGASTSVDTGPSSGSTDLVVDTPRRILVVEDDRTIQLMLKKTFNYARELTIAETAERGLELLLGRELDFVVTDLVLPGMDGLEMIKRARRSFVGACVPIMVLTGSTEENVLLDCFREGADDFMVKPFSPAELRTRVASIYLRQRVARDMNPLTRLPGNLVLKREIGARIELGHPFAVCYVDLDHFKAFNDSHGFDQGDRAIMIMAELLRSFAMDVPAARAFIGHVGGDDFVALVEPSMIEALARHVHAGFAAATLGFYTPEELARGTVFIENRRGELEETPLLSVSIGALLSEPGGLDDLRKIARVAADVKKMAKKIPGNSLFVDRRSHDAALASMATNLH
ncbi:response regulator [Myxococcota bacterium]|nr:response regulator [Myxococcota bacterium]